MDAIFGETTVPALFSPKTGLLITSEVERFLPAGKLDIIPDAPDKPSVVDGCTSESREYQVWIIDPI